MFNTGLTYGRQLCWNRLRNRNGHPPGPAVFHRRLPYPGRDCGRAVLSFRDLAGGRMDYRSDSGAEVRIAGRFRPISAFAVLGILLSLPFFIAAR